MSLPLQTLEDRLNQADGKPSGFDYIRVFLACSIVLFHSFETSYGGVSYEIANASWWRGLAAAILPMFFALSGFLVAGSLERTPRIASFMALRALRILPALWVEIIVWALVLGPLLSTVSMAAYFSSPEFFAYFKNLWGDIQYRLPGLFPHQPVPGIVNAQLWTLPFELFFYGLVVVIAVLGLYHSRPYWLLAAVGAWFILVNYLVLFAGYNFHARPTAVMGHTLVMAALAGMVIFRFRTVIPYHFGLFMVSVLLACAALHSVTYDSLAALPVAYATTYLGLRNPVRNKIILSGDYSYGIFLYGYPFQQAFASLGPWTHAWYFNFVVILPITVFTAVCSWWLVEKPALGLRRYLPGYRPPQ